MQGREAKVVHTGLHMDGAVNESILHDNLPKALAMPENMADNS